MDLRYVDLFYRKYIKKLIVLDWLVILLSDSYIFVWMLNKKIRVYINVTSSG